MAAPIEREISSVPRVEMSALTEEQLCKPGAVKLMFTQLSEVKIAHRATTAELQAERQRIELANTRAISSEAMCTVLRERISTMGSRRSVARLIEFVITILLAYAIDFAKADTWRSSVVFVVLSIVLGIAIFLVDRSVQPTEGG
jgi:hypothetical protein